MAIKAEIRTVSGEQDEQRQNWTKEKGVGRGAHREEEGWLGEAAETPERLE
jgi:hypothetical protein